MTPPLLQVIGTAVAGHGRLFPGPYRVGRDLALLCATWGAPGVADGLYQCDPRTGGVHPLPAGVAGPADLVPGADAGDVQAAVVAAGALAAAVSRDGERGHGQLTVSAGALLAALAGAASRHGLRCCEVAQVFPQPMRDLAAVDGYRWTALGAVLIGRPSTPDRLYPAKGGESEHDERDCSVPRAVGR
jgi:hypothetical protein